MLSAGDAAAKLKEKLTLDDARGEKAWQAIKNHQHFYLPPQIQGLGHVELAENPLFERFLTDKPALRGLARPATGQRVEWPCLATRQPAGWHHVVRIFSLLFRSNIAQTLKLSCWLTIDRTVQLSVIGCSRAAGALAISVVVNTYWNRQTLEPTRKTS